MLISGSCGCFRVGFLRRSSFHRLIIDFKFYWQSAIACIGQGTGGRRRNPFQDGRESRYTFQPRFSTWEI